MGTSGAKAPHSFANENRLGKWWSFVAICSEDGWNMASSGSSTQRQDDGGMEDVKVEQRDATDKEAKDSKNGQPTKKLRKMLPERPIPDGYELVKVPGDGNCVYTALAESMAFYHNKEDVATHETMRSDIAAWLCQNEKHREALVGRCDGERRQVQLGCAPH